MTPWRQQRRQEGIQRPRRERQTAVVMGRRGRDGWSLRASEREAMLRAHVGGWRANGGGVRGWLGQGRGTGRAHHGVENERMACGSAFAHGSGPVSTPREGSTKRAHGGGAVQTQGLGHDAAARSALYCAERRGHAGAGGRLSAAPPQLARGQITGVPNGLGGTLQAGRCEGLAACLRRWCCCRALPGLPPAKHHCALASAPWQPARMPAAWTMLTLCV